MTKKDWRKKINRRWTKKECDLLQDDDVVYKVMTSDKQREYYFPGRSRDSIRGKLYALEHYDYKCAPYQ